MNAPATLGGLRGAPFSRKSNAGARSPPRCPARPKPTRVMRDRKPALERGDPTSDGVLRVPSAAGGPPNPLGTLRPQVL